MAGQDSEFGGNGVAEDYTTNDVSTRTEWAIMKTNPADENSGTDIETKKAQ
jgi:hypothetical protein